ncbi:MULTISPECIES: winged helix-turn-helix domain-containing protein [Pseudomonas]|jgi:DNA-binding response OmpR family regulator|uniref:Winged helix family transcriptional regulator n=2 Tax=Pseudomonas TaxID=286 RepID=A0A4Y9T7T8_PSEFL|nr:MULTISPECIES: winged helix-turn-helix domain-containing protein [Pseudomonas]CRM92951.1 Transcriptional regulatory protein PhoP [Pseudomonas sp. 22 E 5]MCX9152463.1 winged helix-turn-helix domain-containing protein [Pseudomonas sp. TB1-B1]QXH65290.1 winged helix-turn-helix domain-containing protein [Pseudomonas asgharzadehiana]TFW40505.1 winged helix family transcriptional regulator [Pseudomonas fluorescens]TKJ65246.1 winged helix family transcriptional regulator [Pseudomonas sp. CFBP13506]
MHFSNVLAIARTQSKSEDFRALIVRTVPNDLKVDTRCYGQLIEAHENHAHYRAVIIEIDTPSAINQTLDIIRKTRSDNPACTIFVVVTFASTLSKTKYYLAGADYCVKVVETSPDKKLSLFDAFLSESARLNCCGLMLDQDRMCLYGAGKKLEISFVEMKVLEALIQNRLLSHNEIAEVMGLNTKYYDSRALEKSISRLRSKIKAHYGDNIIQNIRGYGYKLSRGFIHANHCHAIEESSNRE